MAAAPMMRRYFDPMETAAIYENPANGWREGVPQRAWLWMLLFCGFYMASRSLWRPFALTFGASLLTIIVFWPLIFIVAPLLWIVSAATAQDLFRTHYMRMGWFEVDPWAQEVEPE